jgi:RNA recognition motif-containing protein
MTTTETATPYTKVFVGNLSFKTKADELAAEFSNAGKVVSANIITRGVRSLGYGFVEMENEEAAHKAVSLLNKRNVGGRDINVEVARPKAQLQAERDERIKRGEQPPRRGRGGFRGNRGNSGRRPRPQGERSQENSQNNNNVPSDDNNSETPSGNTTQVRGTGPRSGASRQKRSPQQRDGDAQQNNNNNGDQNKNGGQSQQRTPSRRGPKAANSDATQKTDNGSPQSPSESPKNQQRRGGSKKRPINRKPRDNSNRTLSLTTLFVANVPFSLRDEAFQELFKDTAPKSAHVVITKNGRSKGFGFVEYENQDQQKAALAKLTEVVSEGRKLAVKTALNPPEKSEASADAATPEAPKTETPQSQS